jgi:hypothetical protein
MLAQAADITVRQIPITIPWHVLASVLLAVGVGLALLLAIALFAIWKRNQSDARKGK